MDVKDLNAIPAWEWPANAGAILKKALRDRKGAAFERAMAADLAGDLVVMDEQMADLLLSIVRSTSEPEEVRARAAISLGPVLEEAYIDGFDDDVMKPSITEPMFVRIQETLREILADGRVPKEVRRRVLEASVRAPEDWHQDAVRTAYSSGDEDWKLTAVFGMSWIDGFDDEILEMLESRNPEIHYEAVRAAGNQELEAAWPHIAALIDSNATEKALRLAAIEASAGVAPQEAREVLTDLSDSLDKEIAEAAQEALSMIEPELDEEEEDEDEEDEDEDL